MENVDKIVMYTDGGSRNNPGPAAAGVYIETLRKQFGHYIGNKTNNEAEYEALIFALKKLKSVLGSDKAKKEELECRLDSELVVKQLNHEYKLKEERIQKYFLVENCNPPSKISSCSHNHFKQMVAHYILIFPHIYCNI